MTDPNRIVIDPAICHGKPVIQGTRVPVTVVVGSLAGGMTFEDVQRVYDVTALTVEQSCTLVSAKPLQMPELNVCRTSEIQ